MKWEGEKDFRGRAWSYSKEMLDFNEISCEFLNAIAIFHECELENPILLLKKIFWQRKTAAGQGCHPRTLLNILDVDMKIRVSSLLSSSLKIIHLLDMVTLHVLLSRQRISKLY